MRKDTADVLKALGQRDRLAVLEAFAAVDRLSPVQAQPKLSLPLGNVSYHVRQLVEAGLLEGAGTTPRRGALEHFYRVTPKGRAGLAAARRLDRALQSSTKSSRSGP